MAEKLYTRLKASGGENFSSMLGRFGIVTVMNAEVHDVEKVKEDLNNFNMSAYGILDEILATVEDTEGVKTRKHEPICTLDTLKVANVTEEGPTKTVTGGQYSNPLIKFGKTARLEMQDALGNAEAIEALCGGVVEYKEQGLTTRLSLHNGSDFTGAKLIVGDSFFIDQPTGKQVKVKILFYQFMPDSIFNLTQDAEGDATVFDMNGDLLTTDILVGTESGVPESHGVFYSVVDPIGRPEVEKSEESEDDAE